jgi:drug/metabolite transporter (DMT)-like permease
MVNPRMNARSWLMLLALSVLWGGSFLFIKVSVAEMPPATVAAGRVLLAALTLLALLPLTGAPLPRGARLWLWLVLLGGVNNTLPFFFINWGQQHIEIGLGGILNATTPFFSVLLAPLFAADERLTPARLAGVVIGMAGVAVLVGPGALGSLGADVWGELAVVLGSLGYAFGGIIARRLTGSGLPPVSLAFGQLVGASLFSVPLALALDAPWLLRPSGEALGALALLAVVCSAFAYLLYFRVLAVAGATNASLVTLMIPLSATALGALVFGERLGVEALAGFALIALGFAVLDGRLLALLRKPQHVGH